jgi:hypothetical protein
LDLNTTQLPFLRKAQVRMLWLQEEEVHEDLDLEVDQEDLVAHEEKVVQEDLQDVAVAQAKEKDEL